MPTPSATLAIRLATLRRYADQHGLDFGECDRIAYRIYLANREVPEITLVKALEIYDAIVAANSDPEDDEVKQ